MKRTPMKRAGWPSRGLKATPEYQQAQRAENQQLRDIVDSRVLAPATRRATYAGTTTGRPVDKANPLQHLGYMKAVRDLGYCQLCGLVCRPQFCHRDEGKGAGLKTDCREGWNGCAECHRKVGTERIYPKEQRRLLELNLGALTRVAVIDAGTWPKRLPQWTKT